MLNKEIVIKRLALIKYLYRLGIEQSKQSEVIASFSILSFHDSVEMFLKLLTEHNNIKSDNFNFLDYWKDFPSLTLKESMRNLNSRRVNIKHKGLLPSKSDIEISRVNTTDFFEQNTLQQFSIDFKDISLFSLIHYENIRTKLEESQQALDNNDPKECVTLAAIAFDELIASYSKNKSEYYTSSPFYFGKDFTFLSSHSLNITDRKMANFVDNVKESIEGFQTAIKILSFGIDYKKYAKFKTLSPIIRRTIGGEYVAQLWGKKKWDKVNCQFCIDFVLESALKLQEFDFDINELIEIENHVVILKK